MLHLANPNIGPPGSFRLRDHDLALLSPDLAAVGPHHAFTDLLNDLNKRRTANGLPPLTDAQAQHLICQHLPAGWCLDDLNHPTHDSGSMSLSLSDVIQGTRTLAGWFARGRRRVSTDEVTRRSYICNSCPHHVPIHGCQGCSGHTLRALVNDIVGGESLPTDGMLQGCAVCHCGLRAKTRLHLDDILPHMPKQQLERLWEKCWIREGAAEAAAATV